MAAKQGAQPSKVQISRLGDCETLSPSASPEAEPRELSVPGIASAWRRL